MSGARRTTRTRHRSLVARAAGWAVAGLVATSAGGCRDEITGPEASMAPSLRGVVLTAAPVTPTDLGTPGATAGQAVDVNDGGSAVGVLDPSRTMVLWLPSGAMDTVPQSQHGLLAGIGNTGSVYYFGGGGPGVWNASTDTFVPVGFGGAEPRGISDDGTLATFIYPAAVSHTCLNLGIGVLWGLATPMSADVGCAPGWPTALPEDVSDSGTIVGVLLGKPQTQAFMWRRWMRDVRLLGSPPGRASAVNGAGTVVGTQDGQAVIFNLDAGSTVTVLAPELASSTAVALNDKGEIVVNTATSAFLLRGSTLVSLATLGGCCAQGAAVNERSQVVGWANDADGIQRPVLWDLEAPLVVPIAVSPPRRAAAMRGHGLLTIVVDGTDQVDVADIDVATIRLGGVAPASRGEGDPMAALEDVDGDGTPELVLKFERKAIATTGTLLLHADLVDGRQVEGTWSW